LAAGLRWAGPARLEILIAELVWRGLSIRPDALQGAYLWQMLSQVAWSYWGKLGWLAVGMPGIAIVTLTATAVLGGLASLRPLLPASVQARFTGKWDPPVDRLAWLALWAVAILALLMVTKNGLTTIRSQGRFLFPSNGALALLVACGWYNLVPPRYRAYLLPGLVLLFSGLNLLLWINGVIPVYYQPFLD
jgi:hypothetical protein